MLEELVVEELCARNRERQRAVRVKQKATRGEVDCSPMCSERQTKPLPDGGPLPLPHRLLQIPRPSRPTGCPYPRCACAGRLRPHTRRRLAMYCPVRVLAVTLVSSSLGHALPMSWVYVPSSAHPPTPCVAMRLDWRGWEQHMRVRAAGAGGRDVRKKAVRERERLRVEKENYKVVIVHVCGGQRENEWRWAGA